MKRQNFFEKTIIFLLDCVQIFIHMRFCQVDNCNQPVFAQDKITRIGYCRSHQHKRTDTDKRSIVQKAMAKQKEVLKIRSLGSTEENKLVINQAAVDLNKMQAWFDMLAKVIDLHPYCENCNAFIPRKFYRAATAHVVPKRKEYGFPSVATHKDNFLVLGAGCGCHSKYDSDWESAAQMKIWSKAVEKFKLIYPFIAAPEKKNIPEVLRQEVLM